MNQSPSTPYDITAIVIARAEGALLYRTLRSIMAAVEEATKHGIKTEVLVVLDSPTRETQEYAPRITARWPEAKCQLSPSGSGMMSGVTQATGTYIAVIEAADLICHAWLHTAFQKARQQQSSNIAVHAELSLEFGPELVLREHRATRLMAGQLLELAFQRIWTGTFLTSKETLLSIPYLEVDADSGFGDAARYWYCNLLAAEGQVVIAPQTCVFVRNQPKPADATGIVTRNTLLRPTPFLSPRFLREQNAIEADTKQPTSADSSTTEPAGLRGQLESAAKRISASTEKFPAIQKSLGYVYRKVVGKNDPLHSVPDWLLNEWKLLAEIEPGLFPDRETLSQVERASWTELPETKAYLALCQSITTQPQTDHAPPYSHVVLLPWLKRGGAEHEAIHYIVAVASDRSNRVLVVLTEGSEAPWQDRLPAEVKLLDFWGLSRHLRPHYRQRLLAQFLVQLQPSVVQIVSSQLGSQIFANYGRALSQISQLYAPAFCAEISPEGKLLSYVVTYLPEYARYLTAIHADNARVLDYLAETFAIDKAKMFVHYQPIQIQTHADAPQPPRSTLHVLWAGRLDRQKRPDLLLAIANACRAMDMHFHAYGSSLLPWDKAKVDFEQAENVTYHGGFNGLASLPMADFDVFLNTSQWDGMPNILLEAGSVGLPIVTSDVGGIGELIRTEETGLLVAPFDDVPQYVAALSHLLNDRELRSRLATNCRELLAQRHSWSHFIEDINRFPGYCARPIDVAKVFLGPTQNLPVDTVSSSNLAGQP